MLVSACYARPGLLERVGFFSLGTGFLKALGACSCHVHSLPGGVAYAGPRVNCIGQVTENTESKRNDYYILVRVRDTHFNSL